MKNTHITAQKTADAAFALANGTADVIGGTAKLAGNTAQSLAPAGTALGTLTTETVALTATTVGAANDFSKQARRIVNAPLDVIASAAELACTPLTRSLRTATKAINAGFDKIDRKIAPAATLAL